MMKIKKMRPVKNMGYAMIKGLLANETMKRKDIVIKMYESNHGAPPADYSEHRAYGCVMLRHHVNAGRIKSDGKANYSLTDLGYRWAVAQMRMRKPEFINKWNDKLESIND